VDGLLALASDLSSAPLFPLTPDPSPVAWRARGSVRSFLSWMGEGPGMRATDQEKGFEWWSSEPLYCAVLPKSGFWCYNMAA
jgi:hypothetical protein